MPKFRIEPLRRNSSVWAPIVAMLSCVHAAHAQLEFDWVRTPSGFGTSHGHAIAVDNSGNVYTAGTFNNTVDFDPGPASRNLTAVAGQDIFVQKLDPAGNLIWAEAFGGAGNAEARGIAVDASGNVHITGLFTETIDFPIGGSPNELTASALQDIFVAKLNSNGVPVWARAMGGSGIDEGYGIAVDATGNVYTTGRFSGSVDFDPGLGQFLLQGSGNASIFVQKLNNNGDFVWARAFRSTGNDQGLAIAVDSQGNPHIAGQFENTVDFDPTPSEFELTSAGARDIFVLKLDPDGNLVWARAMGGDSADIARAIAVDNAGNVYTTGFFNGTADFNPGQASFELESDGLTDAFVSKLNSDGNFVWARAFNGPSTVNGNGIAVDDFGYIYTTGHFQGTVDFDPGAPQFPLTTASTDDTFVSVLDDNGNFVWAGSLSGASTNRGHGIALDSADNALITGFFLGTADFDPGPGSEQIAATSAQSFYVLKLGPESTVPVSLFGRVTRIDDGTAIGCAVVELTPPVGSPIVAVTDANGEYFFESLPDGTYGTRVLAPGFETPASFPVTLSGTGPQSQEFTLFPRAAGPFVTGRVTDADTGQALVGVRVRLFVNGNFAAQSYTCASGRYEIPLMTGKQGDEVDIELEFSLPNYETETVSQTVDPGEGVEIDEQLEKSVLGTAALVGLVLNAAGSQPVPGAQVTLRGPINTSQETDSQGVYTIDTLLDGSYTVTASAPGFGGQSRQRSVAPGAVVEVRFNLTALDTEAPGTPGDINGDGVVNAVDVQLVINAALGIEGEFNADINGDGVVNAVDVQLVINAALGIQI